MTFRMNSNGYVAYKTTKVETADQGKLILIAYDVAIKHCKMSLDKFGKYECIEERSKHLCRAQDAVNELMGALRMDVGEIAGNLYRLYSYIIRRLVEANIKNDRKPVDDLAELPDGLARRLASGDNKRQKGAIRRDKRTGAPNAVDYGLGEKIMAAQTVFEHLSKIRDGFQKVEAITRQLVEETGGRPWKRPFEGARLFCRPTSTAPPRGFRRHTPRGIPSRKTIRKLKASLPRRKTSCGRSFIWTNK